MPFGLVNAPATLQRLMEVVLAGLARTICIVYLEVFERSLEEHNANLKTVLQRIREAGLHLKPGKCHFACEEVQYLGRKGFKQIPRSWKLWSKYPPPKDVKTPRSFLGLASYYRRFVPNLATVAEPLHALTKKDTPFMWTAQ